MGRMDLLVGGTSAHCNKIVFLRVGKSASGGWVVVAFIGGGVVCVLIGGVGVGVGVVGIVCGCGTY